MTDETAEEMAARLLGAPKESAEDMASRLMGGSGSTPSVPEKALQTPSTPAKSTIEEGGGGVVAPPTEIARPDAPQAPSRASGGAPVPWYARPEGDDDPLIRKEDLPKDILPLWQDMEGAVIGREVFGVRASFLKKHAGLVTDLEKPAVAVFGERAPKALTPMELVAARQAGVEPAQFPGQKPRALKASEQALMGNFGPFPGVLSAPALKAQSLIIEALDATLGLPENETETDPFERAAMGGLGREGVNRAGSGTGFMAKVAGTAGIAMDIGLDPLNWAGGVASKTALDSAATGLAPAVHAAANTVAVQNTANWIKYGKKGVIGGSRFGKLIQDFEHAKHIVPQIADSEASKVAQAYKKVAQSKELQDALYDWQYYGKSIPENLKEGASEALIVDWSSQVELDKIHQHLQTTSPALKAEYPSYFPRLFKEPIEEAARAGRTGTGKTPTILAKHEAEDAFNLTVHGLSLEEAQAIIQGTPARPAMFGNPPKPAVPGLAEPLRPQQPLAVGRSKGLVEKVADGVLIKWPIGEEGQKGWTEFQNIINRRREQDPVFRSRTRMEMSEPIPPVDVQLAQADAALEAGEEPRRLLTPITDRPTILARGWRKVLSDKATDELFQGLIGLTDDQGEVLTQAIPLADYKFKGAKAPDGYVIMEQVDPKRNWGPLMYDGADESKAFVHAVREDVAQYLKNLDEISTPTGEFLNDFSDAVAQGQISGGTTVTLNGAQNVLFYDTLNNVSRFTPRGRRIQNTARNLKRLYEDTGVLPKEFQEMLENGVPLPDPVMELSSAEKAAIRGYEDQVEAIYDAYGSRTRESAGRVVADLVTGSPFAKRAALTYAGGALVGAAEGARQDSDNRLVGALRGAAYGIGSAAVARLSAPVMLKLFRGSDEQSTVAAYLGHKEVFLSQGMTEAEAIVAAANKTKDLTQAGWWGRLGGVSEVVGGKSAALTPSKTVVRGVQKIFLNRYIKWPEVQTRILLSAAAKYGWREKMAAAAGLGALAAFRQGGKQAAVGMGLLTEEEAENLLNKYPGGIIQPWWDTKTNKPTVAVVNGRPLGASPMDLSDLTGRGLMNKVLGSGAQTVVEAADLARGVPPTSLYSGAPLQKVDVESGRLETPAESVVGSNLSRYASPYVYGGRMVSTVLDQLGAMTRGEPNAPTPAEVGLSVFTGKVRKVDPEAEQKAVGGAFYAESQKRVGDALRVNNLLQKQEVWTTERGKAAIEQAAIGVADLAEEYQKKGLDINRALSVRRPGRGKRDVLQVRVMQRARAILQERGVLGAPIPGGR